MSQYMNARDKIAVRLSKLKWYRPDWERPKEKWKILKQQRVGDVVVLLTHQGEDYAVFTDLLMPKSYPSDKFAGSLKDGESLYREIIADEKKRMREEDARKAKYPRQYLRAVVWPRGSKRSKGKKNYRYVIVGMLVTQEPIYAFHGRSEILLDGQTTQDLAHTLAWIPSRDPAQKTGDASNVLLSLGEL